MTGTVLIAGAGLAGSRVAETLRALGWRGRIVLAGEEPHLPYERPALSKELLAGTRDDVALRPLSFWASQEIELLRGRRVTHVSPHLRTAVVGGQELRWDRLVIATGARARTLPGALSLRTLDDAHALAARLTAGTRLAILGAGFIGTEVASTALPLVERVTLLDPLEAPLLRALGPEVGGLLAERYRAHGVDVRLGSTEVPPDADVVVAGIGADPDGALLGAGAIETDACGRTAVPNVYACGDVARWRGRRVEHWTSAAGQARAVASTIAGEPEPYEETPYFWSDQFGLRLQHVGHAESWDAVELEGDDDAFTARYLDHDGRLLAALAANRAREVGRLRLELAA